MGDPVTTTLAVTAIASTLFGAVSASDQANQAKGEARTAAAEQKKQTEDALTAQKKQADDTQIQQAALAQRDMQAKRRSALAGSRVAGRSGTILTNFGADESSANVLGGKSLLGG